MVRFRPCSFACLVKFVPLLLLVGCGGGSAGVPSAPSNLTYAGPLVAVVGVPIVPLLPSVRGRVDGYAIAPPLPGGLAFDTTTGRVSGTPSAPAAPANHTITATNSLGSTSYVLSVTVTAATAGGFGPVETLSDAGASEPQVVVAANGDTLVGWLQLEPGSATRSLWGRRRSGTVWSAAERLEQAAGDVDQFALAMDRSSGRAMVAWRQLGGSPHDVFARVFEPGTGYGVATMLDNLPGTVGDVRAAIDGQGRAFAVWAQDEQQIGRFSIWAARFTPGGGWAAAQLLETTNVIGAQDGTPRIAMLADGGALVVWEQSGNPRIALWTNRYLAGAGWGTASELVPNEGVLQSLRWPELAGDATGRVLLVWGQFDLEAGVQRSTVRHKRFDGGWQNGRAAVAEATLGNLVPRPRATLAGDGSAVVGWVGADDTLQVATSAWGGAWTRSIADASLAGSAVSLPGVAAGSSGRALVGWVQETSPGVTVVHGVTRVGATWAPPTRLEEEVGFAVSTWAAGNDSGLGVLVWTQFVAGIGTVISSRRSAD